MRRPTISDVARKAGVGVATVDRVINNRAPVRAETAKKVLEAAEEIGFRATRLIQQRISEYVPERTLGFLLYKKESMFYNELAKELKKATRESTEITGTPIIEFVEDISPKSIVQGMYALSEKADVIAIVSADHQHVSEAIDQLEQKGIPVIAIVTDLTAPKKYGFVGIDHRVAGRTAAWTMSRLNQAPGKVGLIMGSHRILSQEFCESSFRSYCRENPAGLEIIEGIISLEDQKMAKESTIEMLYENPDIIGLYCVGGGVEGLIEALREHKSKDLFVICNEITDITRNALIDGTVDMVISIPRPLMAQKTVAAMVQSMKKHEAGASIQHNMPFEIFISENI